VDEATEEDEGETRDHSLKGVKDSLGLNREDDGRFGGKS
jgi:hypothetical protein